MVEQHQIKGDGQVKNFVAVILLFTAGCAVPKLDGQFSEGFRAFPSARNFDPPGRVFRIKDGVVYGVTTLAVVIEEGDEQTPYLRDSRTFSLASLLDAFGIAGGDIPITMKADLSKTAVFEVASTRGRREWISDDAGLRAKLSDKFKSIEVDKGSTYYLIRETISAKEVSYRTSANFLATLNARADLEKLLKGQGDLKVESGNEVSLIQKFSSPLRIWYKAETISLEQPLGAGPGQPYTVRGLTKAEVLLNAPIPTDSP